MTTHTQLLEAFTRTAFLIDHFGDRLPITELDITVHGFSGRVEIQLHDYHRPWPDRCALINEMACLCGIRAIRLAPGPGGRCEHYIAESRAWYLVATRDLAQETQVAA